MLSLKDLVKVYPSGTRALDGITLDIQPGEFLVLIGLSGSGKSTLLRCINRLIEPSSGTVVFEGADVTAARGAELRRIRRRIGMIFQQFNLVRRTSVFSNVLSGRLGYRSTWRTIASRPSGGDVSAVFENLGRVGIVDKAFARADALSGGQQQRVGIARALMQRPEVMLADEPVASLDPATSHSVMKYLEEINKKDGITVICSLHFLSLARRYGTRVVALKGGRVAFDGKPAEIDERRFKEIYGEDAIEVEIGPERSQPQPMSATEAALRAMADDTGHGAPPEIRPDG
ncbi:MAG: phosphonate ABC transporter ATP-binding protein [Chloroflexi bacterium]|nr:MAG: phosphonate ABC transporter ATP-binding protein [Chloroflexota bacterium]TMB79130.1 MAG: phosphonate ABC transporter ATP-binding protein [Chloroflexota bacterium]TMB98012.1 MAG: phosphonate ABC transporter ATP-binding protein [Chloroflexota bacterium]TMC30760.1 MAG: phosphonate ABC transporter ATP-binding protein [Chloroflexota bacterium]TMC33490.1 MAG: phosphonate ABC transporter ATP-binding protein [Chloroflexota bacterium]